MQANSASGKFPYNLDVEAGIAPCLGTPPLESPARPASSQLAISAQGWVDVSHHAVEHGLAAQVCITHAAWMNAVYFVREVGDRLDPVRENWRMGRLIEEVSCAFSARTRPGSNANEFTLSLEEGFDRLRSLALPAAELHVRIGLEHDSPEIWVDVARGDVRNRERTIGH